MLRTLSLAFAVILACSSAMAQQQPPTIIGPNAVTAPYTLSLSDDWREEPADDPEQRTFVRGDVHLVVSSMAIEIPLEETEQLAWFVVRRRAELEAEVAGSRMITLTLVEPVVVAQRWGQAMALHGSDGSGRQFNFRGFVTRRQVLSTYVESPSLTEQELAAVMEEVQAGLRVRRG
jgi:hypothetical protein